jgi:23S rRNA (uracil-5-)-methyltransferase RumA
MIVRQYPFDQCDALNEDLQDKFPQIKSLEAIINRREDNVILDGKEVLIYGRPYIEEELLGCRFRISARSFYQINPYATKELYSTALDYAELTNSDILIDLYCGTGTMGILGAKRAKKVYGIEIVADAIKDAKINAEANDVHNIQFVNADAGKGAQMIIASKIKADAMIVDPPRKGCSKDTLDAIIKISPKRLVYVSCDPATLARDVKILMDNGYTPKKIQPVDMFPHTIHVETVVLMSRVEGK